MGSCERSGDVYSARARTELELGDEMATTGTGYCRHPSSTTLCSRSWQQVFQRAGSRARQRQAMAGDRLGG